MQTLSDFYKRYLEHELVKGRIRPTFLPNGRLGLGSFTGITLRAEALCSSCSTSYDVQLAVNRQPGYRQGPRRASFQTLKIFVKHIAHTTLLCREQAPRKLGALPLVEGEGCEALSSITRSHDHMWYMTPETPEMSQKCFFHKF